MNLSFMNIKPFTTAPSDEQEVPQEQVDGHFNEKFPKAALRVTVISEQAPSNVNGGVLSNDVPTN